MRYLILIVLLTGCSSVSVTRTDDQVTATYRALFTDVQAPSLEVDKKGEYTAKFNAESVNRDAEFLRQLLLLYLGDTP